MTGRRRAESGEMSVSHFVHTHPQSLVASNGPNCIEMHFYNALSESYPKLRVYLIQHQEFHNGSWSTVTASKLGCVVAPSFTVQWVMLLFGGFSFYSTKVGITLCLDNIDDFCKIEHPRNCCSDWQRVQSIHCLLYWSFSSTVEVKLTEVLCSQWVADLLLCYWCWHAPPHKLCPISTPSIPSTS